jgi:hypothetical protein
MIGWLDLNMDKRGCFPKEFVLKTEVKVHEGGNFIAFLN